jgi:hypothetical protein
LEERRSVFGNEKEGTSTFGTSSLRSVNDGRLDFGVADGKEAWGVLVAAVVASLLSLLLLLLLLLLSSVLAPPRPPRNGRDSLTGGAGGTALTEGDFLAMESYEFDLRDFIMSE